MERLFVQFVLIYALFGRINSQGWSTGDNSNQYNNRGFGSGNDPFSNSGNSLNGFGFGGGNTLEPFRVLYEWKVLDYNWFDEMIRTQSLNNKRYIPENNALAGIKVWRNRIYVTIPRWKEGVPVTLASVPLQPVANNLSPRLEAFPDWPMQEIGNCSALQFVQSMEIDTEGRMWIIDSGRTNIMSGSTSLDSRCPPKLVIIDLNSIQFPFPNQFGPNQFGSQGFPGQNPNYPNNNPYQNPNPPYNPNQAYNPNQPYNPQSQPYTQNNPYSQNQPYNTNQQPYSQNQNSPYSNPYNQYPNNPNSPPYHSNPSGNPYNRNSNSPQYNSNYPVPPNQQGPQGTNYPQGFSNYAGFNSSNPQYDQFGNYINQGQRPNYPGQYPNQGFGGNYNPSFPSINAFGGLNYRIVKVFNFPSNVASQYGSYLNDIVLDNSNGWYAYITDHGEDPGIIVYSFRDDRSWKVKDATSMRGDPDVNFISINNIDVDLQKKNIDGIALSPAMGYDRTLYYTPLGSYNLYSVSTSVLKNPNLSSDISSAVRDLGRKQSITDGMIMDNRGNLYFGLLGLNAVAVWDSGRGHRIDDGTRILARDNQFLQWPDTFSIDDAGFLYVVTNRLQNYITGRVNTNENNYRILHAHLNIRSYLHPADMSRGRSGFDGQTHGYDNFWGSGYNSYYYNAASPLSKTSGLLTIVISFFFFVLR